MKKEEDEEEKKELAGLCFKPREERVRKFCMMVDVIHLIIIYCHQRIMVSVQTLKQMKKLILQITTVK